MEKLFRFAVECGKPWLILVPNYVATMQWYPTVVGDGPIFVAPRKRYQYVSPDGARSGLVGGGCGSGGTNKAAKTTAPFVTMWFIHAGSSGTNEAILSALQQQHGTIATIGEDGAKSRSTAAAATAVVVARNYTVLPSAFKAARDKAGPTAVFCTAFAHFCRERAIGKHCTEWALCGGCSCPPTSPFAHPQTVDGVALAKFLSSRAAATAGGMVPEEWLSQCASTAVLPLTRLRGGGGASQRRPIPEHPGTSCAFWAAKAFAPLSVKALKRKRKQQQALALAARSRGSGGQQKRDGRWKSS